MAEGPQGWIADNLPKGAKLGYDPWLHTADAVTGLRAAAEKAGGTLVACETQSDRRGVERPARRAHRQGDLACHEPGRRERGAKRTRIAEDVKTQGADAAVITLPDSVCWLFNIRGNDVPHTPFALAFAILHADGAPICSWTSAKRSPELIAHLGNAVRLRDPAEFAAALDALKGKTVLADPATAAAAIFDRLNKAGAKIKRAADPCQLPKACKNPLEIEGMRKAHIRDGAALSRFLCWFAREAPSGSLTEIDAAEDAGRLPPRHRLRCAICRSIPFPAPAATAPSCITASPARPTAPISNNEMFLIDSGAQYPDGTTDVTRTVIVGTPTAEMKRPLHPRAEGPYRARHGALSRRHHRHAARHFARRPLWEAGLDYDHGTGHGVGSYLSVHEGPQNISKRPVTQPLKPGMICSNEPGFYKTGEYGIRIENLVVVTEAKAGAGRRAHDDGVRDHHPGADRSRTWSSRRLLTDDERGWLNAYHARVRETLRRWWMKKRAPGWNRRRGRSDAQRSRRTAPAQIHRLHIESKVLDGNLLGDPNIRQIDVYVPHGHDGTGLPLLVDLVGFTAGGPVHTNWKNFGENVPERLDRLIASGAMPPGRRRVSRLLHQARRQPVCELGRHGPLGRFPAAGSRAVRREPSSAAAAPASAACSASRAAATARWCTRCCIPISGAPRRCIPATWASNCSTATNSCRCCARWPRATSTSTNGSTTSGTRRRPRTATSTSS